MSHPPECPTCQAAPMVKRSGTRGEFWGCPRFKSDGCKGTRPVVNGEPAAPRPAPAQAPRAMPAVAPTPATPTDARPAEMVRDLRTAERHIADALTLIQKWRPELGTLMADPF